MSKDTELRRTEIIFVYDIADANPNGDPNDENRPRMDAETGCAKVSDVRLKRTIRDYLHEVLDEEIFCRTIEKEDGMIQDGKARAEDFFDKVQEEAKKVKNVLEKRNLIQTQVLKACVDVRLFGATIPVSASRRGEKDSSVTLTGPVQFAMGTSLHKVEPRFMKGTGAFASGEKAQRKTFREEYVLPYAMIAFYGIVNNYAAKTTSLTQDDVELLYEAIWYGTKNLISRSKIGQRPLLLLLVEYKEPKAYIGRLDRYLSLCDPNSKESEPKSLQLRGEQIRGTDQVCLNLHALTKAIGGRKDKIARIRYALDGTLRLSPSLPGAFGDVKTEDLKFT